MRAKDHAKVWALAGMTLLERGENQPNPAASADIMLLSILAQDVSLAYEKIAKEQEEQDGH